MSIEATIYRGYDNAIELSLTLSGIAIDHSAITRVVLTIGAVSLDSQTTTYFDFTHPDRLVMLLGMAGLAAGRHAATLIIYDSAHPNGLVWSDFVLIVK